MSAHGPEAAIAERLPLYEDTGLVRQFVAAADTEDEPGGTGDKAAHHFRKYRNQKAQRLRFLPSATAVLASAEALGPASPC